MGPVTSGAEDWIPRSLLVAVCLDTFLRGFGVCRSSGLVSIITAHWIKTLLISHLSFLLALHNLLLWPRSDLFDLSPG